MALNPEEKMDALMRGEALRAEVRAARAAMREAALAPIIPLPGVLDTPETKVDAAIDEHDLPARPKYIRRRTRALLAENLPEYARLHLKATQKAAEKGDARPSEWALQSVKPGSEPAVVEPAAKEITTGGIKILIGVNLGGLGTVGPVSAYNEEKANEGVQAEVGHLPEPRVVEGAVVGRSSASPVPGVRKSAKSA